MQRPIAVGLMLCEQIVIEENTRNVTLGNCFIRCAVRSFPSENVPFMGFAIFTDGIGEMSLEVVIQRLDTFDEIYRRSMPLRFANPLQQVRCVFRIRDCSFPVAGEYQVGLLADGEPIASRRLRVIPGEASS